MYLIILLPGILSVTYYMNCALLKRWIRYTAVRLLSFRALSPITYEIFCFVFKKAHQLVLTLWQLIKTLSALYCSFSVTETQAWIQRQRKRSTNALIVYSLSLLNKQNSDKRNYNKHNANNHHRYITINLLLWVQFVLLFIVFTVKMELCVIYFHVAVMCLKNWMKEASFIVWFLNSIREKRHLQSNYWYYIRVDSVEVMGLNR